MCKKFTIYLASILFPIAIFAQCNLSNYTSAYIIPATGFPYTNGLGITVNAVTVGISTLTNVSYTCGGQNFATATPAWWLNASNQSITLTFSQPVTEFTVVVNGTNTGEEFYFNTSTGSVSLSNYCNANFSVTGPGNQLYDFGAPATGTICTVNNPAGSTQYVITHNGVGSGSRISLLDCFLSVPGVTPPVITANGSTTICQGSSVTLTSNYPFGNTWSTGDTTPSIVVTTSGTYTATYTNAGGITSAASNPITVTVVPLPTPIITPSGPTTFCQGGSVTLSSNYATGNLWSPGGAPTQNFVVSASGTFTLTVTDANGCSATTPPITITVNPTPILNPVATGVSCAGATNGTITVNVTSGTPTYQYNIGGPNQYGNVFSNLAAGTYTVTVIDTNGCSASTPVTVGAGNPLLINPTMTPVNCNGGNDGTIMINGSGGTPGYTYSIDGVNYLIGNLFTGLIAGSYTAYIQDANGCISSAPIIITEPTALSATTSQTPTSCNGGNDGMATVSVSGGTPGYSYSWDCVPSQNTAMAMGLSAGTYTCYITDFNGCTTSATVTVLEPTAVSASAVQTLTGCAGGTSTITVTAVGGVGGYQYSIDGGVTYQPGNTFALTAGNYTVTVMDANGCIGITPITVTVNPLPTPTITATSLGICAGASTTMDAGAGYGAYSWYAAPATPLGTSQFETTSTPNTYGVIVTDNNGCQGTDTITIVLSPNPVVTIVPNGSTTFCPGDSLDLDAGAGFNTYSWSSSPAGASGNGQILNVNSTAIYSVTVTNSFGCSNMDTISVMVQDLIAPVITNCPANINVSNDAGVCGAVVSWAALNVTDNCTYSIAQTAGLASGSIFPIGTTTVSYLVTDAGGNTASCSFTVTVNDTENPVIINCPANITVGTDAGVCQAAVTWTNLTVSDNCSATITLTSGIANGGVFPLGSTTQVYTATDAAGNSATCSFTVTVNDTENPIIINCPANIAVGNDIGSCDALITWIAPAVSDNCSANIFLTSGIANGGTFPLGTTTQVYTATDGSGNTATCSFTVTVTDIENPIIFNCPANIVVPSALGQCGATVTWTVPSETDNCPGVTMVQTQGLTNGATFPLGTTTVTYTATDVAGNISSCSFTVTVTDNISPTFTNCPSNIVLTNDAGQCGAVATWANVIATDNCPNPVVTQTLGLPSGSLFPIGVSNVQYTATDGAGNTTICTFTVTVSDNTNPVIINCPANIVDVNDVGICGAAVSWNLPNVLDNCSATISLTTGIANGGVFPIGTTTQVYIATDPSGNTDTCTFTVTVTDTENPVISNCPANMTLSASPSLCGAVAIWTAPTVSDNCSATITQTSGLANGVLFPIGTSIVVYTATDIHGNTATCSFTVTVIDNTPPTITACPANVSVTAAAGCSAIVTWAGPTATDNCSGATITQTGGLISGSNFPLGTSTVTYTATDANGNTATCSFTVTVIDNLPPTITGCPSNITLSNNAGQCGAVVNWIAPTVNDNCTVSNFSQTQGPVNGSLFPIGTTTVEYTAVDATGNTSICSFTVTVNDTENPVIVGCPSNITQTATDSCSMVVTWLIPTATDNCAGVTMTSNFSSGDVFPIGTTTVQYTATDAIGNNTTCSFDITIAAPTPLVLTPTVIQQVTCNGFLDGVTSVNVTGGTGLYTYSWDTNPSQSTQQATGLGVGTYTVFVSDSNAANCVSTQFIKVVITEPSPMQVTATVTQQATCEQANGSAMAIANGGLGNYVYQWNTTPVQNTALATGLPAGTYTVTVTESTNPACVATASTIITTSAIPVADISPSGVNTICEGTSITLTATGGASNMWLLNGMPISTGTTFTAQQAGTYQAVAFSESNFTGCTDTSASSTVEVNPSPTANILAPTTNACEGETVTLEASGQGTYQWLLNSTNLNTSANPLTVSQSGNYQLIVSNTCGTDTSSYVLVQIHPNPEANFVYTPTDPHIGNLIEFSDKSISAAIWSWNFGDTQNGVSILQNPTYTYIDSGIYLVQMFIEDIFGCKDSTSQYLSISGQPTDFIPNVFTPNEDGTFDEFIVTYGNMQLESFQIFDRWGTQVFITEDPTRGWNGNNAKGAPCNSGVYYYTIQLKDPQQKEVIKKGYLTLIR